MIRAAWSIGVSVHACLQHAPTNLILGRLRVARGLSRAVLGLLLAAVYLFASGICFTIRDGGGPSWLAFLGIMLLWNACKFAWATLLTPASLVRRAIDSQRAETAHDRVSNT